MRQSYLADELRYEVIRPTLRKLGLWGMPAEELLLGIAAQETWLGALGRRQRVTGLAAGGPGLGLWQMEGGKLHGGKRAEGGTHQLTWTWLKRWRPQLGLMVAGLASPKLPEPETMVTNDFYACAMARALMLADPSPLPDEYNLAAQSIWYMRVWRPGKGTAEQYCQNYRRLVKPGAR